MGSPVPLIVCGKGPALFLVDAVCPNFANERAAMTDASNQGQTALESTAKMAMKSPRLPVSKASIGRRDVRGG